MPKPEDYSEERWKEIRRTGAQFSCVNCCQMMSCLSSPHVARSFPNRGCAHDTPNTAELCLKPALSGDFLQSVKFVMKATSI